MKKVGILVLCLTLILAFHGLAVAKTLKIGIRIFHKFDNPITMVDYQNRSKNLQIKP